MSGMSVTKTSVFTEDPNVRTCKATTITKTLVIPVIDSLSVTEYETQDGKLVRVNNKPGFYNIIPTEAILSKKTTMIFTFNGTIKLTETCMTSNGVVTNDWEFTDSAHIELPISCSIFSELIRCGALKLTSNKVVTIEVGPTRMRKIVKQRTGRTKSKSQKKHLEVTLQKLIHF